MDFQSKVNTQSVLFVKMHFIGFLQKVSSFRSVPLFACTSQLEDLVLCTHLEDLAEPGVEVVRVCWHSPFQVWRLEGDVLERQGWGDRVENLEKGQNLKKNNQN